MSQVPCNSHIHSGLTHHMVYKGGGGGLAITASYADFLGTGIPSCKLYFGDDPDPLLPQ